jgi:hypothetical protein
VLTSADENLRFNDFYLEHLRKVLLVRGASRYVSKGNYNITRLEYIHHLLPDSRFVIPIRHPVAHVRSLVRQHQLFSRYSEQDARVPIYMRAAGHYEFGPQRVSINLDADSALRVIAAWSQGQDALGYAMIWRSVYAHVAKLMQCHRALAARIRIVCYEEFCANPRTVLRDVFGFSELDDGIDALLGTLPEISAARYASDTLSESEREEVWCETAPVAEAFGYSR